MNAQFILTDNEKQSVLWKKIDDYLEKRINELRLENDSPALSYKKTQTKRLEIQALKNLRTLGNPAPVVEEASDID